MKPSWTVLQRCTNPQQIIARFPSYHFLIRVPDPDSNYNPVALALHALFVSEHNRQADQLKLANPSWDDEVLYQEARYAIALRCQWA